MKLRTSQPVSKKVNFNTQTTPVPVQETNITEPSPLAKAQYEMKSSYTAHVEAQQLFEEAFTKMSQLDQVAVMEMEKRFSEYKTAVDNAFSTRETAEQIALDIYRKTLRKAIDGYREAVSQAIKECERSTKKASKLLNGISLVDYHVDERKSAGIISELGDSIRKSYQNILNWSQRAFRQTRNRFTRAI